MKKLLFFFVSVLLFSCGDYNSPEELKITETNAVASSVQISNRIISTSSKVLSLDGINGYMSVLNHADFNLAAGQSLTVTCKIKTTAKSKRFLSKRPNNQVGYEFIDSATGQFGVNITTSGGSTGIPFGTTNISDGLWHHLAMVIDATSRSCSIYVDGVLEQTKAINVIGGNTTLSNAGNLLFGTVNNLSAFTAMVADDIRFWRKAMTAAEVATDITQVITGSEANLLAAWDFENITGTTVPDLSGRNHPGTLVGGATVIQEVNRTVTDVVLDQAKMATAIGNSNEKILGITVAGSTAGNPVDLTAFNVTMGGSNNINDVTAVKVYTSPTAIFNPQTATLFGSTASGSGNITISGAKTLAAGNNYFFLAYDVSNNAIEGDVLDATCASVVAGGITYTVANPAPAGNRVILLESNILFSPGDAGSKNYRIPAIITAADGSLVTATDRRWNGSGDLRAKIDPVIRRSTDGGKTWSNPVTIANFGGANGAGDCALVVDRNTGNIFCMFVANRGFFGSTPSNPAKLQYCKSTDNGLTWSSPVDITNQIYGSGCSNPTTQAWKGVFIASGRGLQLANGRLAYVACARSNPNNNTISNYTVYSDDGGTTWNVSTNAAEVGGDEAKLVQLDNGDVLMSIRNLTWRRFNKSTDGGITWGTPFTSSTLRDPNVDGDIINYGNGTLLHVLCNSSSGRKDVTVSASTDNGTTWTAKKLIYSGASGYSAITKLADGSLAVYYENGERGVIYDMHYVRFSYQWLMN